MHSSMCPTVHGLGFVHCGQIAWKKWPTNWHAHVSRWLVLSCHWQLWVLLPMCLFDCLLVFSFVGRWLLPSFVDTGDICCHYWQHILVFFIIFSCDQAALQMVFSVRLSVCPSVRLSVCPSVRLSVRLSHLFDYVPIIVSSWNFQELLPMTKVRSMQNVKVRGQRSRSQRSRPKFSFPDCNSSLNSNMMMKWYI